MTNNKKSKLLDYTLTAGAALLTAAVLIGASTCAHAQSPPTPLLQGLQNELLAVQQHTAATLRAVSNVGCPSKKLLFDVVAQVNHDPLYLDSPDFANSKCVRTDGSQRGSKAGQFQFKFDGVPAYVSWTGPNRDRPGPFLHETDLLVIRDQCFPATWIKIEPLIDPIRWCK